MTDYTGIIPAEVDLWCDRQHDRWEERFELEIDGEDVRLVLHTIYSGQGGTPEDIWHGRRLRYPILGNVLDRDSLQEQLQDGGRVSTLIDAVIAGHSIEWNGNNNVGRFTDDAESASEELGTLLYDDMERTGIFADESVTVWDAADWLLSGGYSASNTLNMIGLTADAAPEQIAAKAKQETINARADGCILSGDLEDVLQKLVAKVREESAEYEEE